MSRFIKFVTMTGADDSVFSLDSLQALSEDFPFVEYGILFDTAYTGRPRYPSSRWLKGLGKIGGLTLSGHLCGRLVQDFLKGEWIFDSFIDLELAGKFSRWQLNTHGIPHDYDMEGLRENISRLASMGQSVIFQFDGVNTELFDFFLSRDADIDWPNVNVLYDLSHGGGLLPNKWPILEYSNFCGFAGGLSPDNIHLQAQLMQPQVGEQEIWVGAETHIRSNGYQVFDLSLVSSFLQGIKPFICG